MSQAYSRLEYLRRFRRARAWAALDHAVNQQMRVTHDPCMPPRDSLNGKHVVIIGSGIGGLTTAYELLSRNSAVYVTVLEARDRTGGRCLTLRTGDTLTEDENSDLHSQRGESQVVRFERPVGDREPYLNAGPGRIPSSHKRLLHYLRRFGVEVEVYVMASGSNMTQMEGGPEGNAPVVNRRLTHNTRGWIAQMVYDNAEQLIGALDSGDGEGGEAEGGGGRHGDCHHDDDAGDDPRIAQLQSLMVTFGDLNEHGRYVVGTADPGQDDDENVSDRAGFAELPGVRPGKIAEAIGLDRLLASEFWIKTRFYQPVDFLWQPTMFQPVGGMDRVQHAFAQQVASLGGMIHLNSPVTSIDFETCSGQFVIEAAGHNKPFRADYCFCNVAIPFLQSLLSERLQDPGNEEGLAKPFKDALQAVYVAQKNEDETKRFLACTTKVGWQADRHLWQGRDIEVHADDDGNEVLTVHRDEVGVVPIYGGISWTDHPITQIWYPSNAYHDRKGILTGCYNFSRNACRNGKMSVKERLTEAEAGAARFGKAFSEGLENGVAIAWQNMAHIKGGWAQWSYVGSSEEESVLHYNNIIQGSGVDGEDKPCFFIVGDQVSSLPGWQEGAVASALNAISRLVRPDLRLPHLVRLPDTKLMVEGL